MDETPSEVDFLRHIQMCIVQKKDLNERMLSGLTKLQMVSFCGYAECVLLLLQHGADSNITNEGKLSALHLACQKGNFSCGIAITKTWS